MTQDWYYSGLVLLRTILLNVALASKPSVAKLSLDFIKVDLFWPLY